MKKERYFRDELERMFITYAIIPAVVFTLVCGLLFMAVLLHGRKSSNAEHNRYAARELERVLDRFEEGVEQLAAHPEYLEGEYLEGEYLEGEYLKGESMDGRRSMDRKAEIFEVFYGITNSLGLEGDLFLMDSGRELLLSSRKELPEYLDVPGGVSWGILSDMDRRPGETVVRLADGWKSGGSAIAIGRSVLREGQPVGYILCSIPGSQIQALIDKLDTQTIIADSFGRVCASSNFTFLNTSNQVMKVLEGAGRYLNFEKQMYLVSQQQVYHRMFTVYSVSDIQNIVISLSLGGALVITAIVLMTLWMLLNSRKVTAKKTEDFYKILDVMDHARDGNLEEVIRIHSDNEFKIIADAYNETIRSLKVQMENNRKMAELVAMAQNKQLESQFNPHFLYNTLENIRYMCKLEPDTAERMVFCLSNLLRYSLDGSKAEVTLREDMEHLEHYITILKRRFGARLQCRIHVEPEAYGCRIPKLVLQPMIENAVKYGFGRQLNLNVELKAYTHEGKLIMICRDDGVGIPQGTLSQLNALLEQKENPTRHFGLYNIHRRIGILYGRPYGVEIRSAEGHGTTLVVTLPARNGE